jgi:hypothetical protein
MTGPCICTANPDRAEIQTNESAWIGSFSAVLLSEGQADTAHLAQLVPLPPRVLRCDLSRVAEKELGSRSWREVRILDSVPASLSQDEENDGCDQDGEDVQSGCHLGLLEARRAETTCTDAALLRQRVGPVMIHVKSPE